MLEESKSLFRDAGNTERVVDALDRLAGARVAAGKLEEAKAAAEEGLALLDRLGDRAAGAMYLLDKVALIAREQGDGEGARTTLETVLAAAREFDDSWWATRTMVRLALWSFDDGELTRADELTREAARAAAGLGDRVHLAESFGLLASIAAARGESGAAGRYWGALEELERERAWLDPESRAGYSARVDRARGPDFAAAAERMGQLAPDDVVRQVLSEID